MSDTLSTITHLIQSPPGQLAAGGVLAGIVWKFFERVEAVLTDQTKLEIAVWLLGVKVGDKVEPWPKTFVTVFDRVFGTKHLSWKCLLRSCVASLVSIGIVVILNFRSFAFWFQETVLETAGSAYSPSYRVFVLLLSSLVANLGMDYLSLLKTRLFLGRMGRTSSVGKTGLVFIDFVITSAWASLIMAFTSVVFTIETDLVWNLLAKEHGYLNFLMDFSSAVLLSIAKGQHSVLDWLRLVWFYPAFFTSIWLWLYAGSGFILKAARRFDIGFDWFNRKFDIEKKPLQSIGLVAGALVAVAYWAVAFVSRVVG